MSPKQGRKRPQIKRQRKKNDRQRERKREKEKQSPSTEKQNYDKKILHENVTLLAQGHRDKINDEHIRGKDNNLKRYKLILQRFTNVPNKALKRPLNSLVKCLKIVQ